MAKIQIKSEKLTPFGGFFFDYGAIWFSLPWGHHKLLIDKFLTVPQKALFYVRQTVANGWSRNVLHNFIDSSLYERQGKALSNFNRTLPDVGQLGGYVVACNHLLRKEGRDNPTIGILICKEKDRIQAQYALESSSQPIAISEYDLEKFYPEKLEGTMPTIEEWEAKLGGSIEQ